MKLSYTYSVRKPLPLAEREPDWDSGARRAERSGLRDSAALRRELSARLQLHVGALAGSLCRADRGAPRQEKVLQKHVVCE